MASDNLLLRPDIFAGRRFLVTGGATGLGREMAEALAVLGATVHICGRRGPVAEATAKTLSEKHGATVIAHACDIREPEQITAMLDAIWAEGSLDGLVNNAAGNFIARTEDLSIRGFDAIANTVFRGTFYTTLECGKRWIAEKRPAAVVSIIVSWVFNSGPFVVPSAMSKAGVAAMTKSLAVEWARHGIRLNAIAPGTFPTEGAMARLSPEMAAEEKKEALAKNPMHRFGEMHELANLCATLLAPGMEYLTGQAISIDGGEWLATGSNFYELETWSDQQWEDVRAMIKATTAKDKEQRTT